MATPTAQDLLNAPTIDLPKVRPYQRPIYESPARFKHLLCGRRWGKSKLALASAIAGHGPLRGGIPLLRAPTPSFKGALQGARIAWILPSQDHPSAEEIWRDLKRSLGPAAVVSSEEKRRLVLPNGGSIQLWSGYDADTLRGPFFDGVVVDECSIHNHRVWAALRPTLSDYQGWAILCGTVPDDVTSHWFILLHNYAASDTGKKHGWATWRLPSWQNPQLLPHDLEEARDTLGSRLYQREYGAELLGIEGGVWRESWFQSTFYDRAPTNLRRVELFLDAAWKTGVHNDFSSCQLWGVDDSKPAHFFLLDELHGKWEAPDLRRRVAAFRKQCLRDFPSHDIPLVVESAGGGLVAAQEFRDAYDFTVDEFSPKGSTKVERAEAVSAFAEAGRVHLPSPDRAPWVRDWLAELAGFPQLPHDDRCDSATMALQRLREPAPEFPFAVIPPAPRWYETGLLYYEPDSPSVPTHRF